MPATLSEANQRSPEYATPDSTLIGPGLAMAIAVGTGLLLRAGKGYRPFPSIDDFIYIPHARAILDSELFSRDTIIQEMVGHTPLWTMLIRGLESTVGLSLGLWLLTVVLSIATAVGMMRLIRSLGGSGLLLPIAAIAVLAGAMNGLGRGTFDGAFGDAVHMQWIALTLLLFVYDAVIRQHPATAGVLLGLAAIVHPMVAAHGAVAVTCSVPFWKGRRLRSLFLVGTIAFAVSSPVSLTILTGILAKSSAVGASVPEIANRCYLFRLPHEYFIGRNALLLYFVYVSVGLAGASVLSEHAKEPSDRCRCGTIAGLIVGHVVILAASVLMHGEMLGETWTLNSLLPFQLHLTRTTPLLLVMSAVAVTAAFEREVLASQRIVGHLRWGRLGFWCIVIMICFTLLFAGTKWTPPFVALLTLGFVTVAFRGSIDRQKYLVGIWGVAAAFALVWHVQTRALDAPLADEEAELYTWVQRDTTTDALFIVPPGMQEFRFYSLRSVYVDFKFFPTAIPALLPEWRRRLEKVSVPDAIAMADRGYPCLAEWDRTYANRNTPQRIANLLTETDADYLVWDRQGLDRPPYVAVNRREDPRVSVCFENERFKVYRKKVD